MEGQANNRLITGSLSRGLIGLAWPMLASALLQNLQSVIDLFWVGKLGAEAVAALAIAGTILMLVFPLVMGAASGTVALVSRAVGAGNIGEASGVAGQSLVLAVVMGLVTGAAGIAGAPVICAKLAPSPEVAALTGEYITISFAGCFTIFVLFLAGSALRGSGNTVIPMAGMVLANIINLALDPVLIFGLAGFPRMGVRGAALATVIAQLASGMLMVFFLSKGVAALRIRAGMLRLTRETCRRIMRIGIPGTGQMLSRSLMALVLVFIVGMLGTEAVAAYGVAMRIHMMLLMSAFVLGDAAAVLVGQNLGAGRPWRANKAAWIAAVMDISLKAVFGTLVFVFSMEITGFFTSLPEVIRTGSAFLRITSPVLGFVSLAIILSRCFIGAGDSVPPMICTVISLWGLQVPLAFLLPKVFPVPAEGIWWAISITSFVHGVLIATWFSTGRWKSRVV